MYSPHIINILDVTILHSLPETYIVLNSSKLTRIIIPSFHVKIYKILYLK